MSFRIDVVTIFPDFFKSPLRQSLLGKAIEKGLLDVRVHNLRDYTRDRHRTVDAKPFGGGPGMVMMPGPIFECVEAVRQPGAGTWTVALEAKGEPFTQKTARTLAGKKQVILIAGHYEGLDHRVHDHLVDQVLSAGDFVSMGGEAPALCVIEAVARFLPGVLGNQDSLLEESYEADGLEYPQYTKPRDFRGWKVPEVLVSGNHARIAKWRREAGTLATRRLRPDLEPSSGRSRKKS